MSNMLGTKQRPAPGTEGDLQHLLDRVLSKEVVVPKDKYVVALLSLIQREECLDIFFAQAMRSPHLKQHQVVVWKALGFIHRLMHTLDGPMFKSLINDHIDSINFLQRLCDRETSVYAKASSVLGQLLFLKATFHQQYPDFTGNMGTRVAASSLMDKHGKDLLMRLLELQQLNIACMSVVLSLTEAMPSPGSGARSRSGSGGVARLARAQTKHRHLVQDQSQSCLLWSIINVVLESVSLYESCFQLLVCMHRHGHDTRGVSNMFQAQHLKLKSAYGQVRTHPYLSSKLYTLDLGPQPPSLTGSQDGTIPLPARVQPKPAPFADFGDGGGSGSSSAPTSPAVARRTTVSGTQAGNKQQRASESKRVREMQHEQDLLKATIASLEDYIRDTSNGLTHVDPDVVAAIQGDALGEGHARAKAVHGKALTLRQRYQQVVEENQRLQARVAELEDQAEEEALSTSTHTSDMQQEVEQVRHESQMLQAHVASLTDIKEDLEKQLDEAEQTLCALRADVTKQQETTAQLRRQMAERTEALEAAATQQGAAEDSLQATKEQQEQLQQQLATLRREADTAHAEAELARSQLATMTKERDLLSSRVAELKTDAADEAERRAEIEQALDAAEKRVEEASARAIAATSQELEAHGELQQLRKDHADAREKLAAEERRVEALEQEKERAQQELADSREEHTKAQAQLKEEVRARDTKLVDVLAQDASSARELQQLQAKLEEAQAQLDDARAQASNRDKAAQHARQEAAAAAEARERSEAARRERETELEAEVARLQERAEATQAKLKQEQAAWAEERRSQETEVAHLRSQVAAANEEKEAAASQASEVQARAAQLEQEVIETRSKHTAEMEQLQRAQEQALSRAEAKRAEAAAQAKRTLVDHQTRTASSITEAMSTSLTAWRGDARTVVGDLRAELVRLEQTVADHLCADNSATTTTASASTGAASQSTSGSGSASAAGSRRGSIVCEDDGTVMAEVVRVGTLLSHTCSQVHSLLEQGGLPESHEAGRRCDTAVRQFQDLLYSLRGGGVQDLSVDTVKALQSAVEDLATSSSELTDLQHTQENLLEQQMSDAATVVDAASKRMEQLLENAQSAVENETLKVDEKILDQSLQLTSFIKQLIATSSDLQQEIVTDETSQGKKTSVTQFYKRNSRWVDGLVSAAKAVGAAASVLVDTADRTVAGSGKLEEIMVCGQEITASTAQLVSASRVKARRKTPKKAELETCSRQVHTATQSLIEAVRDACQKAREVHSAQDYLKLTLTQARRLQMDSQVRVKELEYELLQEQERLRQLRKAHYHLSDTANVNSQRSSARNSMISSA